MTQVKNYNEGGGIKSIVLQRHICLNQAGGYEHTVFDSTTTHKCSGYL